MCAQQYRFLIQLIIMNEESFNEELKAIQTIQKTLQGALQKREQVYKQITQQNMHALVTSLTQMLQTIQISAPAIEKFNHKVFFNSRQILVPKADTTQKQNGNANNGDLLPATEYELQNTEDKTIVNTFLNQNLGIMEHAIIEQIQLIDSEKKESSSYSEINESLSNRIYHVNKTMDQCIHYLLKNL